MASITYDGRSLLIDGKRIWLVSGSIQYTRVPREYWADRIHAAKLAGLNCVDTSVVWARH
ncbi:MAG: beta-galactosidase, partial [Phycisphaerae bacterium]